MTISSITIGILLLILVFSYSKLLFWGDDEERTHQKILGGLVVFAVALVANSVPVYVASVFIGGLIIASENFMLLLAAILRSKDVPAAISALGAIRTSKATPQEIEEKNKEESVVIEEDLSPERSAKEISESINPEVARRLKKVSMIENLVQTYLKEKYSNRYFEHRKITTPRGTLITDGVMLNTKERIKYVVEIRYITEKSFTRIKYILADQVRKIYSVLGKRTRLLTVLVSDSLTAENAHLIFEENKPTSSFLFFKWENGKIINIDHKQNEI